MKLLVEYSITIVCLTAVKHSQIQSGRPLRTDALFGDQCGRLGSHSNPRVAQRDQRPPPARWEQKRITAEGNYRFWRVSPSHGRSRRWGRERRNLVFSWIQYVARQLELYTPSSNIIPIISQRFFSWSAYRLRCEIKSYDELVGADGQCLMRPPCIPRRHHPGCRSISLSVHHRIFANRSCSPLRRMDSCRVQSKVITSANAKFILGFDKILCFF